MIKLLYTGAATFEGSQGNPMLSLGGFVSSSEVPNGSLGNLFSTLSKYTIEKNKAEVRVIAIKNVSGDTLTNFRMYLQYPATEDTQTNVTEITVGVGEALIDECGDIYVPNIGTIYSVPPNVQFLDIEGEVNTYTFGDFYSGDYHILYIKRTLKDSLQAPLSDEDLLAIFNGTLVLDTVEDIKIFFFWD